MLAPSASTTRISINNSLSIFKNLMVEQPDTCKAITIPYLLRSLSRCRRGLSHQARQCISAGLMRRSMLSPNGRRTQATRQTHKPLPFSSASAGPASSKVFPNPVFQDVQPVFGDIHIYCVISVRRRISLLKAGTARAGAGEDTSCRPCRRKPGAVNTALLAGSYPYHLSVFHKAHRLDWVYLRLSRND